MHFFDGFQGQHMTALSPVGLGAWAFGGVGWGPQEDRDSIAAIHHAVELGVNWIDTAAVYGAGHAEQILREALGDLPETDRPFVFTKGGIRIDPRTGRTYRDLSPVSLRAECDASLRRLQVPQIDLYQLHWPVEDTAAVELAWMTLDELRREGKIRWVGVSNFDVDMLTCCSEIRAVDVVQAPLSLLDRQSCDKVLPWAADHGAIGFVYSPLASGLLSGHFTLERLAELPTSDWRRQRPQFRAPQAERALQLVAVLQSIAEEASLSLIELAVAWTLRWPGVGGAIVGARSASQVDGWIRAGSVTLSEHTLDRIATALSKSQAGIGTNVRPPSSVRSVASQQGFSADAARAKLTRMRRSRRERSG
jgi:aryl-alcohol dehydrogenase-like predicted oxidoreductase